MPELQKPVQWINISYICDSCGEGEMLPTGETYATNPAKHLHSCTKCGHKECFITTYPYQANFEIPIDDSVISYDINWDQIYSFEQFKEIYSLCNPKFTVSCKKSDPIIMDWIREKIKEGILMDTDT